MTSNPKPTPSRCYARMLTHTRARTHTYMFSTKASKTVTASAGEWLNRRFQVRDVVQFIVGASSI